LIDPAFVAPVPEVTEVVDVGEKPARLTIDAGGDPSLMLRSWLPSGLDDTPLNPCLTRCARCRWRGVRVGDVGDNTASGDAPTTSRGDSGGGDIVGRVSCKG